MKAREPFRPIVFFLLALAVSASAPASAGYTLGRPLAFDLEIAVSINNRGTRARAIRIKLPVPAEQGLPAYEKVTAGSKSTGQARVALDGRGQAVISLDSLEASDSLTISLRYHIEARPITHRLPWFQRREWPELPDPVKKFLVPSPGIESDAAEIAALAHEAVGRRRDPVFQAKALYAATNRALTYDPDAGIASAREALKYRRARCEGYARLYAALCRAVGIPARLVYGLRLGREQLAAEELSDPVGHVWNEVYLAGPGWVPVDPTFVYTVDGRHEITYDFFARLGWNRDVHLFLGYSDQTVSWTYRVRRGHPGVAVERHLRLRRR